MLKGDVLCGKHPRVLLGMEGSSDSGMRSDGAAVFGALVRGNTAPLCHRSASTGAVRVCVAVRPLKSVAAER